MQRKKTNKSKKLINLIDKSIIKEPHRKMKRGIIATAYIVTTNGNICDIK